MRDPAAVAMLDEFAYGSGPDASAVDGARALLEGALRALLDCDDVWDTVTSAAPQDVVIAEPFASFTLQPERLTIYAAPDLLVRPAADAMWQLTDFKTGRADGVIDQLLTYGVAARDGMGLAVAGGVVGRVVALGGGPADRSLVTVMGPDDLADAAARIRASVAEMQSLLRDTRRNLPLAPEAFAPAGDHGVCRRCQFRGICHPADYPTRLVPRVPSSAATDTVLPPDAVGAPRARQVPSGDVPAGPATHPAVS